MQDNPVIKDRLADLCDHQPFIARAPFVLVFLADTRRWLDASLGIGSCYIGDVLENREQMTELLGLDRFVFPVTLLVFGYPAPGQSERTKPSRPRREYLVQQNRYRPRTEAELRALHSELYPNEDFDAWMAAFCARKYQSAFAREMNRSVKGYVGEYGEG